MVNIIKTERNELIEKLRDEKGWSFARIAKELRMKAKSSVHEAYYNHKKRSALTKNK